MSKLFPDDTTVPPSVAHRHDYGVRASHKGGLVPWSALALPDLKSPESAYTTGRLRHCGYCGSVHPADLAAWLRAGAKGSWADWKYGWPHKAYIDHIPSPWAGQLEARQMQSERPPQADIDAGHWVEKTAYHNSRDGKPVTWWYRITEAPIHEHAKFYTVHLLDATPEEKQIIEQALGLAFTFEGAGVSWRKA